MKFEERGSHWYMVTEEIGEGLTRFTGYRPPRPKKQKVIILFSFLFFVMINYYYYYYNFD